MTENAIHHLPRATQAIGTGEAPPGYPLDPAQAARLDDRIARMRALLDRMQPNTGSEALQVLRRAFPETSLQDRVAVAMRRHGG